MFYDKVFNHMITHCFVLQFSALFNMHKKQGPEEELWLCKDNTGDFSVIIILSSNEII